MVLSSDHWRRVESLFYEAVELEPAARKALLDDRCRDESDLRNEVESLLASAHQSLDVVEQSIQNAAQEVAAHVRTPVLVPGVHFSRYEVVSALGAGGMGEVYLVYDSQLRRNVALKLLAPELTQDERGVRRFEQEALAASALNHPNILTVHEFAEVEGTYYLASEFVEGETLRQRVRRGKSGVAEVTEIAIQIASALEAAHARGIVHRDIKPDNVIVRNDGIVKVLDFGIAKLNAAGDASGTGSVLLTILSTGRTRAVPGTVRYMSPEQARGQDVDGRSDLFSLGVVMYELLTGQTAFQGETANDVIAEILKGEPAPLRSAAAGVPAQLEAIVLRAMRKCREERYPSSAAMLRELKEFRREYEFRRLRKHPDQRFSILRSASSKFLLGLLALAVGATLIATPIWRRHSATPPNVSALRTLAVLPFRNLQPDPRTDFLGFSLADAVITKLGYVKALTVRPSSSIDQYRNQMVDPQKVAADLKVDTLLTGTFLTEGNDLRITTQLIDVKANKILWQDTIDQKYDRLLTVQDTVSQQLLNGLEVSLSPAEERQFYSGHAVNAVAYEYYLRGVDLYSLNDFRAAIEMLEKGTHIDPNYAPLWAHLGRAYTTNASLEFGGRDEYLKAQAAYEKALAIDPSSIEVRVYMGNLLTDTGHVEQAVPLLRGVLKDDPAHAEAQWELGYAYRFGGMLQESAAEAEKARQNNPSVKINSSAMNAYLYLGEFEKFLETLPSNDSVYVLFYHGFGEYYLGQQMEAAHDFDRAYDMNPALLPVDIGKALSYEIAGNSAKGIRRLHATEDRILKSGVSDAECLYKVAQAYAVLGDKSSALRMFQSTVEGGFFPSPYFERDPLVDNLRQEPRFTALMAQARARHEQFKARFF